MKFSNRSKSLVHVEIVDALINTWDGDTWGPNDPHLLCKLSLTPSSLRIILSPVAHFTGNKFWMKRCPTCGPHAKSNPAQSSIQPQVGHAKCEIYKENTDFHFAVFKCILWGSLCCGWSSWCNIRTTMRVSLWKHGQRLQKPREVTDVCQHESKKSTKLSRLL